MDSSVLVCVRISHLPSGLLLEQVYTNVVLIHCIQGSIPSPRSGLHCPGLCY